MAYGAYVIAIVAIVAALYTYFSYKQPEHNQAKPQGLDSFRVTYNQEGIPLPLHWGVVRLPGNLLYYGNLDTDPITERMSGGFGGSKTIITGYEYEIDHWQAVCLGPAMIYKIWVDNKEWIIDTPGSMGTYTWYNTYYGNDEFWVPNTYYHYSSDSRTLNWSTGKCSGAILSQLVSRVGANANGLPGLAFAWHPSFLLGENVTYLQTLHYGVERYCEAPVTNANMSNGCNPAAIIHDVITMSGNELENIDANSFDTAGAYWNTKGYGLNIAITQQTSAEDIIRKVLSYVDGVLYINDDDKFVLNAFTDSDSSAATITTDDFVEFIFERPTWNETFSDFRAEYINGDGEFEKRTLRVMNSAVRSMVGYVRQMSVDLSAYRDKTAATKRLWEIVKKHSYPVSNIQFVLPIKYITLNIGEIITISHSDYGIVSAQYRITAKDYQEIDNNTIRFAAVQYIEALFDDNYADSGDPLWTDLDRYAYPPEAFEFFELPFNPYTERTPSWLILAQRANQEVGFQLMQSVNNADYYQAGLYSTWSMKCNLDVEYPATPEIDDEIGMILTPDFAEDPPFTSVTRNDLFLYNQLIIVGGEIMAFQNYEAYGNNQIRLTGIVRNLWHSIHGGSIAAHTVNSDVWLTSIGENVMEVPNSSEVWMKVLPFYGGDVVPEDEVTAVNVTVSSAYKAASPWRVGAMKAVRDSSTQITLTWYPCTQDTIGAGEISEALSRDLTPPAFEGEFRVQDVTHGNFDEYLEQTTKAYTGLTTGQKVIRVTQILDGEIATYNQVTVGTAVGEYWEW